MFFQNRREQSITAIVFKYVGDKSLKKKNQNYFKSKYLAHSNFLKMLNELWPLQSVVDKLEASDYNWVQRQYSIVKLIQELQVHTQR